jgi:excisionase family DNA binding protein
MTRDPAPRKGTLGGSNRMLSARDVAAILGIPERTVRDKWREWGLPAYRIGRHLRSKERDVYAASRITRTKDPRQDNRRGSFRLYCGTCKPASYGVICR